MNNIIKLSLTGLLFVIAVSGFAQNNDTLIENTDTVKIQEQNSEISPEQIKKVEDRIIEMIQELTTQINIIGYKSNSEQKKNDAISTAMSLFSSEDNTVKIRSIKNPNITTTQTIKNYLNRVKLLAYSDIKITAFDVKIPNNLTKMEGKEGWYYGTASYCQRFEYDNPINSFVEIKNYTRKIDITCPNTPIIVHQETICGENVWRVFLSDISVVEY